MFYGSTAHFIRLISPFPRNPWRTCLRKYNPRPSARNIASLPKSPLFEALLKHDTSRTAVIHSRSGRTFTYGNLLHDVAAARLGLSSIAQGESLAGERVAFLVENGYDYVVAFLSIIANNAVALPVAHDFPNEEIRYILENSGAKIFLATTKFQAKARDVLQPHGGPEPLLQVLPKFEGGHESIEKIELDGASIEDAGFMLYTSGTTSRPKGVVLSTSVIMSQARSLMEAWQYQPSDLLLNVLPLHHIHGTINALFTPLIAGSTIEFAYPFNTDYVWRRFAAPFLPESRLPTKNPVTFFTAVPTIYSKLLDIFSELSDETKRAASTAVSPKHLRVNISGSAALPAPIKRAWKELSDGNVLLERYGMTEVGMALSCGLEFDDRVDGSVGWPLPTVEVRLANTETGEIIESGDESCAGGSPQEGEIQLRGPTIFSEYWQNPEATVTEFVDASDGMGKWFKTGDIAVRQNVPATGESTQGWAKGPMYFIRGRRNVDIIKTGGEKVSALEVERELLSLPQIAEAVVFGIDSERWGQKVAAVVVLTAKGNTLGERGRPWGAMDMRRALKDKLAGYKIPQDFQIVDNIPRNAMGKVNKKSLANKVYRSTVQER